MLTLKEKLRVQVVVTVCYTLIAALFLLTLFFETLPWLKAFDIIMFLGNLFFVVISAKASWKYKNEK